MIYPIGELQNPLPRKTMLCEGDLNNPAGRSEGDINSPAGIFPYLGVSASNSAFLTQKRDGNLEKVLVLQLVLAGIVGL